MCADLPQERLGRVHNTVLGNADVKLGRMRQPLPERPQAYLPKAIDVVENTCRGIQQDFAQLVRSELIGWNRREMECSPIPIPVTMIDLQPIAEE